MSATKSISATKARKGAMDQNGVIEFGDVLTLSETAAYLRVDEGDILNLVHSNELFGKQIGDQWRFLKSALQEWLSKKPNGSSKQAFLNIAGKFKEDPYLEEIVREAYRSRGRLMMEE